MISNTNTSLISIFHDLAYTTIDVVFYHFIQHRCNVQHIKKEAVTHLFMSFSGEKKNPDQTPPMIGSRNDPFFNQIISNIIKLILCV